MFLKSVSLTGFRSFAKKVSFKFDPKFTLVVGPNSVGKTNLLEALFLIGKGHGFREKKLYELISQQLQVCTVESVIEEANQNVNLTVKLINKNNDVRKMFYINKLPKSFKEYVRRTISVVLFQPDDLLIISGTPDRRRSYFDKILMHTDYQYYQARHNFSKGLYKRNKILENQEQYGQEAFLEMLRFWDQYLRQQANILQQHRGQVVAYFNQHPGLNGMSFAIEYQQNNFIESSDQNQLAKELRVRKTQSGPQLDEFLFRHKDTRDKKNISEYGSRSEQRLCILWMKINELRYLEQQNSHTPILLMDDIFSELDSHNSERILRVSQNYQTIVTTAHLDILPLIEKARLPLRGARITLSL